MRERENVRMDTYNKGSYAQWYLLPCPLSSLCFCFGNCTSQTFPVTDITKKFGTQLPSSSVQFRHSVVDSLWPHGLQHVKLTCPSQLPEATQTHVHQVSDAIQTSHPVSSPSPPVFNLSQHQGLFQWVSSSHQVAKGFEFQLHHQSFQWIFRTHFL